jgi:hypothetical protein
MKYCQTYHVDQPLAWSKIFVLEAQKCLAEIRSMDSFSSYIFAGIAKREVEEIYPSAFSCTNSTI